MSETECPTCTDSAVESQPSHIYLFVDKRGTNVSHFLVEAANPQKAEEKLNDRFEGFEDAECLGSPKGIMDLHKPDVVML